MQVLLLRGFTRSGETRILGSPSRVFILGMAMITFSREKEAGFLESFHTRSFGCAFLVACLILLGLVGCPTREEYTPPDLLYHYKDLSVGKNPTSIRASDFNADGFADLITTNIQGNSLS